MSVTAPPPTVQASAFVLPTATRSPLFVRDGSGERLRCASVIKPLLFWAAAHLPPYSAAPGSWERLAAEAVTVSANAPTVQMWRACGAGALLDGLEQRTGMRFPVERGGARSFGRVLVTADEVALGYARLAAAEDHSALLVRNWMLDVPDRQTFEVRPVIARTLGVTDSHVGVKCGWFCDTDETRVRTHVVTMTCTPDGVIGTVVLTALAAEEAFRRAHTDAYRYGDEVLELHEQHAGPTVRAATKLAAASALSLIARERR